MTDREYWRLRPEWLRWVRQVWVEGKGRVQQQYPAEPDHPDRVAFAERATDAFLARNIPVVNLKTWVSVQVPEDGDGYAHGYPHVHHPLDGVTLVHYLQVTDEPAMLDIFDGDLVVETIRPAIGLTVFMPNSLRHGVRKQHGRGDRVQLIATALPR